MRWRRLAGLVAMGLALTLLLTSVPPPASGGPEPPSLVATAFNTQRKLARGSDGTLYAAVTVNASGTPAARVLSTVDGASWTALPPPPAANESDRTALAIDSRGWLHLAWTEVTAASRQVVYSRYEAGYWTAPVQLSHSPGYAGFPALAVDAGDRVHAAWYATDGTYYQIYYRRLDASGWTAERALTSEAMDATNPAVALDSAGHVHIAWGRVTPRGTSTEIAYLRLEGDVVADSRVLSLPDSESLEPTILVRPSGRVEVAWSSNRSIHHRAWEGDWTPVQAVSPAPIEARAPSLALWSGNLELVWEGGDGQIYRQTRVNDSWSAPVALSQGGVNRDPTTRWSQFPATGCPGAWGVDVVWTEGTNGTYRLGHTRLGFPPPCPPPADRTGVIVPVLVAALLAGIAAIVAVRRRRGRTR